MLDTNVVRPANIETTAAGAAFLAGMAVGIWNGPDDIAAAWKEDRTFSPAMKSDDRAALMKGWQEAVGRTSSRASA
jgi:glycerol kinase